MKFLKHLFPISMIITLCRIERSFYISLLKNLFIIILPLLFITVVMTIMTLIGMFIIWDTPDRFYFPFISEGEYQSYFDRFMLLVGFIICLMVNFNDDL